jgi:hypothetical protein
MPSRVLRHRRDTPDNEKWSGRWESKIPLVDCGRFLIMVLQALMSTACDYCAKNVATAANASEPQPV